MTGCRCPDRCDMHPYSVLRSIRVDGEGPVLEAMRADLAAYGIRAVVASPLLFSRPLRWHLGMIASNRAVARKHLTAGHPVTRIASRSTPRPTKPAQN